MEDSEYDIFFVRRRVMLPMRTMTFEKVLLYGPELDGSPIFCISMHVQSPMSDYQDVQMLADQSSESIVVGSDSRAPFELFGSVR